MQIKVRKIKHKTHKCFGIHSRVVDGVYIQPIDAGGRSVGSKQVHPGAYKDGDTRMRTRAELRNAADRQEAKEIS